MKRWLHFLWFIFTTTLLADRYEVNLTYNGPLPILKIAHFQDDDVKIAEVEYKFSFKENEVKQWTLFCQTTAIADWAPVVAITDSLYHESNGMGVQIGGLLFWLRNDGVKLDGLVVSGETDSNIVVTANRIVLGNRRDTHFHGDLTLNGIQRHSRAMVRGEVVVDGDCRVDTIWLGVDTDTRWYVHGTVWGKFKELQMWRRSAAIVERLEAPRLESFTNDGTFVVQSDVVAPQAVVKNLVCVGSKSLGDISREGRLIVNGNCQVKSLARETFEAKQRNITQELLEKYGEKRGLKTFLDDVEVERVRKQMLHLVGRSLLPGFTNEEDQLWQFFKNTVEEHHRLKTQEGLLMELGHLSKEVWERLRKDVVWLQESTINGDLLLTLVWFPCRQTLETLQVSPSMVVGGELNLTADGNWVNQGLMEATQGDVHVTVSGSAHNQGGAIISRNGVVDVQAGVAINHTNGLIQGATNVRLSAPVIVGQTQTVRSGHENAFHTVTGGEAEIRSGGDLSIEAGSRLELSGSHIWADGDITLRSGDTLHVTPALLEYRYAPEGTELHGMRGIYPSVSGRNIYLNAQGEVVLCAPYMHALENWVALSRDSRMQIRPFTEVEYEHHEWENDDWWHGPSRGSTTDLREHLVRPELSAGQTLRLHAHDDLNTTAMKVQAAHVELGADRGEVRLEAGRERSFHQEEYTKSGWFHTTQHNEGYDHVAVIEPIMAYNDVRVIGRLMTEVKRGRLEPWVVDLCAQYEVDLREVLETNERWHEHTKTLSGPFRTLLAVGLTIFTGGWGADYIAAHYAQLSSAVAKGVGTALEGITNSFAVSCVANGGDIGKAFDEVAHSGYLKRLVAGAVGAGLVSKFVDAPLADRAKAAGDPVVKVAASAQPTASSAQLAAEDAAVKGLDFRARLGRNLRAAAFTSGTTSVVCGGKITKAALDAATGAVVDAGAAEVAHEIGTAHVQGDLGPVTHKAAHAALGAASSALTGQDPAAGAIGAAVAETVAEVAHVPGKNPLTTSKQARFVSSALAFLAARDPVSANDAAQNAIDRNFFEHLHEIDTHRALIKSVLPKEKAAPLLEALDLDEQALLASAQNPMVQGAAALPLFGLGYSAANAALLRASAWRSAYPGVAALVERTAVGLGGGAVLCNYLETGIQGGPRALWCAMQNDAALAFAMGPAVIPMAVQRELGREAATVQHLEQDLAKLSIGETRLEAVAAQEGKVVEKTASIVTMAKPAAAASNVTAQDVRASSVAFEQKIAQMAKVGKIKRYKTFEDLTEEQKRALPRLINLVGPFEELKKLTKGFGHYIEAHEVPSWAALKHFGSLIPRGKNTAVILLRENHVQTRTFGVPSDARIFFQPRQELALDLIEVIRIYQRQGLYSRMRPMLMKRTQEQIKKDPIYKKE